MESKETHGQSMASRSQIKKGLALHGLVDYLVQMERGKPVPAGQACTVISALSQSGKFRMAKNLAEHIIKTNSPKKMDGVTKCVSQLILDCMARRKVEYARDLMAALKAKGMSAETRVYTQMLNSHLMAGKLGDAASVLKDIKKVSGELGLDTYGILIQRCLSPPIADRMLAESIYKEMVTRIKMPASTEGVQSDANPKTSDSAAPCTINTLLNLGTKVLSAHSDRGDYKSAAALVKFMELKDIQLDLHAYTTIVEASAKADIPDFALHWFQEISRRGHSIDVKALHALMLAYVRVNKITPAMQIYDEIVKRENMVKDDGEHDSGVLRALNLLLQAVPNEKRRKRMGYLKKVMEEMQKRELKPDGYTYSHLVQQFSQMGLRDQIKTAFTLAVDDARLLISKMKEGDKESLGCERGRSFPLSSALYSQMIRHLQVEKGTVEEFLKVLSVAMEFQDHVQVDGKAILSIMRGLRSCGAFKEVVEVYKWARSSPLGLLAFNHSTCPAGYTFNRCLHMYLYACRKLVHGEKSSTSDMTISQVYAKWLDVMTKEMQYLLRHGYPVTERNWLTFCGVVVRLKRSPLVAVKTMDEGLKEYIAALGENNGGKSIMEALRVTAVMLEVMVMRLVRKGDKFARGASIAMDRLGETLAALQAVDAEFVEPECFEALGRIKSVLKDKDWRGSRARISILGHLRSRRKKDESHMFTMKGRKIAEWVRPSYAMIDGASPRRTLSIEAAS